MFEAASGNDSVNSVNVFFSVLDISNYVFLLSLCQQKIIKNYKKFLVNDMKDELLEWTQNKQEWFHIILPD